MNGEDDPSLPRPGSGARVSADPYREAMWEAVSASWDEHLVRRHRARVLRARVFVGAGIAATLLAGILVGRWSVRTDMTVAPFVAGNGAVLSIPQRVALDEHLREAETVLVLFETAEDTESALADRARELAATTRMLMASGAAQDAELAGVLQDLELLLLQIAQTAAGNETTELDITRAGIRDADTLARLRLVLSQDTSLIRNPI